MLQIILLMCAGLAVVQGIIGINSDGKMANFFLNSAIWLI